MAKIFGSFKRVVRGAFDPLGKALARLGVSANAVTVAGTAGVMIGAFGFAARGRLVVATVVVTLCALLDVLDGAMARARGRTSRFGGLLDSVMDRVADGSIFAALTWWLLTSGQRASALAALICLVGGQVVSYVRARAEGLGLRGDVGIAERLERLIIIGVGALLWGSGLRWALPVALWLLAGLSVITIGQRIGYVWVQDRRSGESIPGPGQPMTGTDPGQERP
jgi:CDP-diacylglycerol---glycerol-3-phosphate 3-phosphatidyltransferase